MTNKKMVRDALGSAIPQTLNDDGTYTVMANGDTTGIDFSQFRLLRDVVGSPLPYQYFDVDQRKFVPGSIGGGELDPEVLQSINNQLSEKAAKTYGTPEEYGALKNGTHNDALAFRAAYDDGIRHLIPTRGKYTMQTDFILNINESVTITGENRKETIIQNGSEQDVYQSSFEFRNCKDVSVSNLTMDGNIDVVPGDIWEGVVCLRYHQVERGTVRDVTFQNNKHAGIFLRNAKNILIENCEFNNLDTGINAEGTTTGEDLTIRSCKFNGHIESEPICIQRTKRIRVYDCIMLNKTKGHAIAFEGSEDIYINNIYAENCGNGFWTVPRDGVRVKKLKIENSRFINMATGSILRETDDVEINNCYFEDGFHSIVGCNNVTFRNCTFKAVNKPCMIAFSELVSDNVKFINCTFDNTAAKNWGDAVFTFYDPKIKATNVVIERCNFINSVLLDTELVADTTIKMIDCIRNGTPYGYQGLYVTVENSSGFKTVGNAIPANGFHKKGIMIMFDNPTTHIGAINTVEGYGFGANWATGITVWARRNIKLSNGIVVKAKNGGTVATDSVEPIAITAANNDTNPLVDSNGIQWVYLGVAVNFKNFGAIAT